MRYLATLNDAAFGTATEVQPKFVSPSDPAAQWTGALQGPAFFAYADNYLIDIQFGVIVDVETSRAVRQAEAGAARTMVERTDQRFGLKPQRLAADSADGWAPIGIALRARSKLDAVAIFRASGAAIATASCRALSSSSAYPCRRRRARRRRLASKLVHR